MGELSFSLNYCSISTLSGDIKELLQIATSLIYHSYLCSLLEYFSEKGVISAYSTQNRKVSISMYRESDNQMGASCQISIMTDNSA